MKAKRNKVSAVLAAALLGAALLMAGCNDDTLSRPMPSFESGTEEPSASPSYVELPIPYPSWFFSKESEEPAPLASPLLICKIKKGMSYAQVSEMLGFRGEMNEEACVYDWRLENGDLLQITFDFPQLFHYKSPDDLLVFRLRIAPADETLPVRYSVYLPKNASAEQLRRILIEAYNWHSDAADCVDRAMKDYDISSDTVSFPEGFYLYEIVTQEDDNPERLARSLLDEMVRRGEEQSASR